MKRFWKASICILVAVMFVIPASSLMYNDKKITPPRELDPGKGNKNYEVNSTKGKHRNSVIFEDKVVPDDGSYSRKTRGYEISWPPDINVDVKCAADEEFRDNHGGWGWTWYAQDLMKDLDWLFATRIGINFGYSPEFATWNSNDNTHNLEDLFNELRSEVSIGDQDVLIGFTGQKTEQYAGLAELLGDEMIVIDYSENLMDNLLQHEASHLFGCPDHIPGHFRYCVMSYAYSYDTNHWCIPCWLTIQLHKRHFE